MGFFVSQPGLDQIPFLFDQADARVVGSRFKKTVAHQPGRDVVIGSLIIPFQLRRAVWVLWMPIAAGHHMSNFMSNRK